MLINIISTPLLLQAGVFRCTEISLESATSLVAANEVENFCGHQTVKLLGLDPAAARKTLDRYDVAIAIKPTGRLEFGREYAVEEIKEIGFSIFLIEKIA